MEILPALRVTILPTSISSTSCLLNPLHQLYSFLFQKNCPKLVERNAPTTPCCERPQPFPKPAWPLRTCSVKDHPTHKEGRKQGQLWEAPTSRGRLWEAREDELWKASKPKHGDWNKWFLDEVCRYVMTLYIVIEPTLIENRWVIL